MDFTRLFGRKQNLVGKFSKWPIKILVQRKGGNVSWFHISISLSIVESCSTGCSLEGGGG